MQIREISWLGLNVWFRKCQISHKLYVLNWYFINKSQLISKIASSTDMFLPFKLPFTVSKYYSIFRPRIYFARGHRIVTQLRNYWYLDLAMYNDLLPRVTSRHAASWDDSVSKILAKSRLSSIVFIIKRDTKGIKEKIILKYRARYCDLR